MRLRVVLDSNVYVSGLSSRSGTTATILQAAQKRRFTIVLSPIIINEIAIALRIKRGWGLMIAGCSGVRIIKIAVLVQFHDTDIPQVVRDVDDNHIVAAAIVGKADLIVSGDKDLYTHKSFEGIGVSRPLVL